MLFLQSVNQLLQVRCVGNIKRKQRRNTGNIFRSMADGGLSGFVIAYACEEGLCEAQTFL